MIIGVGTDLLDIARVKTILEQSAGERFLQRILTPAEQELAASRKGRLAEFAAGRFAAKEAVVKALGCGIGKEVTFQDVEVLPDGKGKPVCRLSKAAWERVVAIWTEGAAGAGAGTGVLASPCGIPDAIHIHLSITHTETMAMAYAVVEQLPLR
ncbi:holo-ACP synthase [Paenibacillus cremeus]|uniref:Holo-[acyl-carrier-protein] synthase n=1 Tax=Paenibacillus cremeus TaxID=2163881 RepID=A0A559KDJ6_9BACL|nr:holo-ACP synthase [Paenibacillus cremeus]TVY10200.1 holo-[acyl-carrier-protein] synthase [Paenibacillus cremeus]